MFPYYPPGCRGDAKTGPTTRRFGSQDYGAFVDIGLGRTDALMPNSMMGDKVGRGGLTQL